MRGYYDGALIPSANIQALSISVNNFVAWSITILPIESEIGWIVWLVPDYANTCNRVVRDVFIKHD